MMIRRKQPSVRMAKLFRPLVGDPMVEIRFTPFSQEVLGYVRSLKRRWFYKEKKVWYCVPIPYNLKILKDAGFVFDDELERLYKENENVVDGLSIILDKDKNALVNLSLPVAPQVTPIKPPTPDNLSLYPFQELGVGFIESRNGRALIADEMGLGKTVQVLGWLTLHRDARPAVVVCPASIKLNWEREVRRWLPNDKVFVLEGTTPSPLPADVTIFVINYDILVHWRETLHSIRPQVLIVDECHYIKNRSAKRTNAVLKLGADIPYIIALSGTPIINRPVEVWTTLKMLMPDMCPSFWDYARRYCDARRTAYGWDFSGASNLSELHEFLTKTIMIRRLKADVLTELPAKQRSAMPLPIKNRDEYRLAEEDFAAWLRKKFSDDDTKQRRALYAEALTKIEYLKQIVSTGKMDTVVEWIRDYIDVDGKLVVFGVHRKVLAELHEKFASCSVKVDGDTPPNERLKAVDEFQNNPNIRLFVGNVRAAGVGINLTQASAVAFVELPWTPGELIQAEDRAHRIGQKNALMVYYLIGVGTIEERILHILNNKQRVLDSVLEGKAEEEKTILDELLDEYLERCNSSSGDTHEQQLSLFSSES